MGIQMPKTHEEGVEALYIYYAQHVSQDGQVSSGNATKGGAHTPMLVDQDSSRHTEQQVRDTSIVQLQQAMASLQVQMQQIASAVLRSSNDQAASQPAQVRSTRVSPDINRPISGSSNHSAFSTVSTGQAVKLLSTQIPEFDGSEESDVELWIQKVEHIATIHRVSQDTVLLAASSKLIKNARKWYDLASCSVYESWDNFKNALTRRFKRRVLFQVIMRKAEARHWIQHKESFEDYAMDKLHIMQRLGLQERDAIQYLISGISNPSLRGIAASLQSSSIDLFLEEMHSISLAYGDSNKKSWTNPTKEDKFKLKDHQKKSTSPQRNKDLICNYCKAKGHIKSDCYKLKKKEQAQGQPVHTASSAVAAVEEEQAKTDSVVALVDDLVGRKIETSDCVIKVNPFNNPNKVLYALLDTGSPVSFIRLSVFNKSFKNVTIRDSCDRSFQAANGKPIPILGLFSTNITLETLPDFSAEITLHIFNNDCLKTDLIIGRDFLDHHNITVVYSPENKCTNKLQLLSHVASADVVDEAPYAHLNNMDIDFDNGIKHQLISTILEVENSETSLVQDDYHVKISLKDDSVFACGLRRFAFSERLELRAITDDLLNRGIIKPSTSPYCSRVVPVRKKNNSLRLCVDLRPLNERVNKQHYPFPLIEDCLSRLSNKKVFSLLDLRDGFHQIKLHPDVTKYFAFATPDGQFEFLRLPFGYCDAPAEFQRRLVQILQPLVRDDKVIIYMDDILIATITVGENLDILKETLLLLKCYGLELNYNKCLFLRKSVEYLGYVVSAEGITLSSGHIEAVQKFPTPTKVVEVQRFLGLTNFFRKYIPNYAAKAKPLHDLLKKNVSFDFEEKCLQAFQQLKNDLISKPILSLFNPKLETELHTDASATALAAILLQKQTNGLWAPVAYYSQVTNKAEANYHSFELEMLAVVKAVERFHIYLYGLTFNVVTDCHAVVYAVSKANLNPRIARWVLRLQNYKFKVSHRAGLKMAHVDSLSNCNISGVNAY